MKKITVLLALLFISEPAFASESEDIQELEEALLERVWQRIVAGDQAIAAAQAQAAQRPNIGGPDEEPAAVGIRQAAEQLRAALLQEVAQLEDESDLEEEEPQLVPTASAQAGRRPNIGAPDTETPAEGIRRAAQQLQGAIADEVSEGLYGIQEEEEEEDQIDR